MFGVLPHEALSQAKTYVIKGQALEAGTTKPVRGATIRLVPTAGAGRSFGAYSDGNGNYTISAATTPGSYVLTARYLGFKEFKQTITLGDNTELTVAIGMKEDLVRSEEIIVTGTAAGTTRKQLGNAIGTVSFKDVETSIAPTLDAALAGKISGALIQQNTGNPSGGMTIRLRGTSTFSGNADPLYIVDGILINNDSPELINFGGYQQNRLADINPNDIERIEVLKGAAAAAIYGSRANNGVVQIFTKSGSFGAPRINFSTRVQASSLLRKLPMNLVPLAPPSALAYRLTPGQTAVNTLNFTPAQQAQFPYYAALQGRPVVREDVQDLMFQTGIGSETYLSVDGGAQGTRYSVSGSHFDNQGILRNTSFQRSTGRVRVEQVLNEWATISATGSFSYSNSNELPNEPLGTSLGSDGYGAMLALIFTQNFLNPRAVDGVFPGIGDLVGYGRGNPLEAIQNFKFNQRIARFIGGVQLKLTPVEGLNIDYTLGYDGYNQFATAYIPPNTSAFEYPTGLARTANYNALQLNNDLNISYRANLTDEIRSVTQLGGTLQYERRIQNSAQSRGLIPIVEIVPGGASNQVIGENRSELVLYGGFLQQTFSYNELLTVTLAGRFDASSVFGVKNRWQFFPKASVSGVVSELWKGSELENSINTAKLRAAYGESGGLTSIGPFDRFTPYNSSPFTGLGGLAVGGRLGTPDVRPERQREIEIGFDLGFLNDRLGVEFTWYNKRTTDVLLPRPLAGSTGFSTQLANVGTLTNTGIEMLLRFTPVQSDDFTWNATVIANNNRNVMNDIVGGIIAGGQYAAINGQPFPVMYERYYARNPDGSIILDPMTRLPFLEAGIARPVAADGTINDTPQRNAAGLPTGTVLRKVIGDPNPQWTGSFINEFRLFKAFTVRIQFDGMYLFNVLNYTRRTSTFFGTHEDSGKELTGELPAGHAAAVVNIFEHYVERGDFTRLRELAVSYDWQPTDFMGIKVARFTLSGRNLLLLTNYRGYDPEINSAAQGNRVRGADFATVPPPRVISLGVNLTF
jgi:TonB-linked SusC/RagA family outer membrane protein